MIDVADHLERLYETREDPWGYQTSVYEAAKYAATIAALTRRRYASALEAGCSIGVLSALLAPRCDRLLAVDMVERAVAQAATRLVFHSGARAIRATLPADWPPGSYDLIILSEVLYYLTVPELDALARHIARDAAAGAECVIVHYQGPTGTAIRPDAARNRFCCVLSDLRTVGATDQPAPVDYNHRTLLLHA